MQKVLNPDTKSQPIEFTGLSTTEVQDRIRRGESNDFEARVGRGYTQIIRDNVLNLFNIVLGTLLVIVIWMGDYSTAFFAGFSVVSNSFFGMIQEINAKRKLDQLAALSEQIVPTWRNGELVNVPMKQLVKDDIIKVEPGDRIVVDGVVLKSDSLEMDESLLTGESDAIFKQPDDEIYSGSFCVAGTGVMKATRVGAESNINQLSTIAKQYKNVKTPTQKKIDATVEITVIIMFIFVPMLFIANMLVDLEFLQVIRNAVVFVTSLVPQGLVLVGILSLTIGAIKISRHDTLIQRVNAVESLANATVLCFDKTGTLTKNKLAVTEIIPINRAMEGDIHNKLYVYLKNLAHLNHTAKAVESYVDAVVQHDSIDEKEKEIPFTSARKWGAVVMSDEVLVMGAPERLLPMGSDAEHASELAKQGMRVLAFATATVTPNGTHVADQVKALALIVMSDQIRDDIQETLQAFRDEGISLKVISGDNIETVRAIAGQAGMDVAEAYTGEQLSAMDDDELDAAVSRSNVFARIEPDTKQRIVDALQRKSEYVAMVGDGVNDVPALKKANLAIVMNDGTQISKDVADIVLLNNAMSTLPLAFREGKETTQTIFGTMKMFLVRNFYNVMLFIFIGFMALPFPITPVQISWATFGTVNLPATLIAFGLLRPEFMKRFRHDVVDYIMTVGMLGSVLLTILYIVTYFGSNGDLALTRSTITILVSLLGMQIAWNIQGVDFYQPRTFITHWRLVLLMIVLTILTILAMYMLPELFEFRPLTANDMSYIVVIVALFGLSLILTAHGMKFRYLLNRLWLLFEQ